MQLGSELLFDMRKYWLGENELKSSAFSLKSVMKLLLSYHNGGIRGIFYYLKTFYQINDRDFRDFPECHLIFFAI